MLFKIDVQDLATQKILNIGRSLVGISTSAVIAVTGVRSLRDALREFGTEELAINRLRNSLRNMGRDVDAETRRMITQAQAIQRVTTFTDDQVLSIQGLLTAYGLQADELDRATQAAVDYAATGKLSLETSAQLIGKAFLGVTNTLRRYGIVVSESATRTEKFDQVLGFIEGRFGGMAAANVDTYIGRMDQLSNSFNDVREAVAGAIAPALQDVAVELKQLADATADWVQANEEAIGSGFVVFLEGLKGTVEGVTEAFRAFRDIFVTVAGDAGDWKALVELTGKWSTPVQETTIEDRARAGGMLAARPRAELQGELDALQDRMKYSIGDYLVSQQKREAELREALAVQMGMFKKAWDTAAGFMSATGFGTQSSGGAQDYLDFRSVLDQISSAEMGVESARLNEKSVQRQVDGERELLKLRQELNGESEESVRLKELELDRTVALATEARLVREVELAGIREKLQDPKFGSLSANAEIKPEEEARGRAAAQELEDIRAQLAAMEQQRELVGQIGDQRQKTAQVSAQEEQSLIELGNRRAQIEYEIEAGQRGSASGLREIADLMEEVNRPIEQRLVMEAAATEDIRLQSQLLGELAQRQQEVTAAKREAALAEERDRRLRAEAENRAPVLSTGRELNTFNRNIALRQATGGVTDREAIGQRHELTMRSLYAQLGAQQDDARSQDLAKQIPALEEIVALTEQITAEEENYRLQLQLANDEIKIMKEGIGEAQQFLGNLSTLTSGINTGWDQAVGAVGNFLDRLSAAIGIYQQLIKLQETLNILQGIATIFGGPGAGAAVGAAGGQASAVLGPGQGAGMSTIQPPGKSAAVVKVEVINTVPVKNNFESNDRWAESARGKRTIRAVTDTGGGGKI